MRQHPTVPKLALKNLYWRCCVTCYTLGCSRPSTLGKFLWNNVPCVQSLMLMSISGRFEADIFMDRATADMVKIGEISEIDEDSLLCVGQGEELLSYLPSEKRSSPNPRFDRSVIRAPAWRFHGTRKQIIVGSDCVAVEKGYPSDVETALNELEFRLAVTLFAPGFSEISKKLKYEKSKRKIYKDDSRSAETLIKPLKFNKDGSIKVETRGRKRKHITPTEPSVTISGEKYQTKRLKIENFAEGRLNDSGFAGYNLKYFAIFF